MFDAENSKKQGDIGLGAAIAYYTSLRYTVCIPLTDSQDYDLVVDIDGLKKVQVKTGTFKEPSGGYKITLKVSGGNKSGTGRVKKFDNTKVDYLFILTDDGCRYHIPAKQVTATTSIVVGQSKWNEFKL